MKNTALDFTVTLAKEAGEILLKYFGTKLTKQIKTGPTDFATNADLASEEFILEKLQKNFPEDSIITEESGAHGESGGEYTWIVDPLDGTYRFSQGEDNFGVMICRAHGKTIEMTVVYNPKKDILATGVKDEGTYLNGERVNLTKIPNLDQKPVAAERGNREQVEALGYPTENFGACGNTLVVLTGQRRAYVSNGGWLWDFAPPALLLAEAGWHVTDFSGKPFIWDGNITYRHPGVIAAPKELHTQLLSLLTKF